MTSRKHPTPHPREDAFFGLHIDLHAHAKDTELGRRVDEAMVRRLIRAVRPQYIQYDCKGHNGCLAYPHSKVSESAGGPRSKGIRRDSLAIYRKVTREEGVALLAHFSGVWDDVALRDNKRWATLDPKGKRRANATSTWSDYVTKRMIPQMKEVIDRYDMDGFWVDGDCWATRVDYCKPALEEFEKRTGVSRKKVPLSNKDEHWITWTGIARERFLRYVKTWLDEIHAYKPGIKLASNWLFSAMAPAPVSLPVDFLSGDYSSTNAVNEARLQGRYLASTGQPWDLMAWAHVWFPSTMGNVPKPAIQLMQEAAPVLALGGGFQMYLNPDRHGGIEPRQIQIFKEVADFCLARQDVCFRSAPIPQVVVLVDTASAFRQSGGVFNVGWGGEYRPTRGVLQATLDAGHSVDLMAEHQLLAGPLASSQKNPATPPVIVVPEWHQLERSTIDALVNYTRAGGSLLLVGARTSALFQKHLGVRFVGEPTESEPILWSDHVASRVKGEWQRVQPRGATVLAWHTPGCLSDEQRQPAATLTRLGKGRIAAVFGPVGASHQMIHSPATRDLIHRVLLKLYTPIAALRNAPPCLDLALRKKDGRVVAHLVNTTNMPTATDAKRPNNFFVDHIPAVTGATLELRCGTKPRRVTFEPGREVLSFRYDKGVVRIDLPPVHIHHAVVID